LQLGDSHLNSNMVRDCCCNVAYNTNCVAGADSHYEEAMKFEEASLESLIECASTKGVVCPMCTCNPLQHHHSIIHCHCGLQIDTAVRFP
jgi:hypothetical protein